MSTEQKNKYGIKRTDRGPLDLESRVANDAERDLLITQDSVEKGCIIWHEADQLFYFLSSYPSYANLAGVVWTNLRTVLTDLLTVDSSVIGASAKSVKILNEKVDAISFLDENNPPIFVDSADADNFKDSLRFTFTGGAVIDISIKDLIDLGAFNSVTKRSDSLFILDFTTSGGTTVSVDVSAWFNQFLKSNRVLVNGNPFTILKHTGNNVALNSQTVEVNDFILNGFWDNTTLIIRAKFLGGNVNVLTNWLVMDFIDGIQLN